MDLAPNDKPYLIVLLLGTLGAMANLFPIELAFNLSLFIGNAAYVIAASFLRPSLTLLCALISVIPLYFYGGNPFFFLIFGLEAWFISTLRARGWYVLAADLLYWIVIGAPLTLVFIWSSLDSEQSYILLNTLKQAISAVFYISFAYILLFIFNDYFKSIKSSQPRLVKSLPTWLLYFFWNISAFLVISISLALTTGFGDTQRKQLDKELAINNDYITHIGNSYLKKHQIAIENLAYQLSSITNPTSRQYSLSQFHYLYPGFLTMLIASEQGKIELASPQIMMEDSSINEMSIIDRPYFIAAMQEQKLFVSSVFLGRGFGADPIVAISAPIYSGNKDNKPSGIVEGSLNLKQFGLYYKEGSISNRAKFIVTDDNNRIIYASASLGLKTLSKLKYDNRASQHSPNLISLSTEKSEGEMFRYKQAQLDNNWKVYSLFEHKGILKVIENMYLVMFITLFFILLSASFFAEKLATQLGRTLSFAMKQLSKA